ncbi:MAG: glycosyltransferase [Ignavibacteria bacterium]|nr:glycosyltransferase [Ignavibacteria bacterium]
MLQKFSIVTPTLNQAHFIKDTIESVLNQNYKNFEHIIVDGGSTDNTLEILKDVPHLKWISEKDSGPANAINKGFQMATGDIFAWINSDDYYVPNIFEFINSEFLKNLDKKLLFGHLIFIDKNKKKLFDDWKAIYDRDFLIRRKPDIRQPSTFFLKSLYQEVGELDEELKIVFDYDLFLRMLSFTDAIYTEKKLSYFRVYNETLTNRNFRKQALEIFKVSRRNGGKIFDKINLSNLIKLIYPGYFKLKE